MDRREAEKIYASGKEATVLALLELAAKVQRLRDEVERLAQTNAILKGVKEGLQLQQ